MKKLLIICGSTSTGKTSLGINLAKKFNGEIVSADSRQVYRGMDIGTGKNLPVNPKSQILNYKQLPASQDSCGMQNQKFQNKCYEIEGVKLWLYDVCEPNCQFNVADYIGCARVVISDIWQRGKLPILVGGTGFYIKALVEGIESLGIKPDWELRKQLDSRTVGQLASYLKKVDPTRWDRMNESDRQNPHRLIRAIEIARCQPIPPARCLSLTPLGKPISDPLLIGLKINFISLYQRIDQHVDKRVKSGVENEIKSLLAKSYNWRNSVLRNTIGYQQWQPFFKTAKLSNCQAAQLKADIIQRWKFSEHAYARRQMTWFKKQPNVNWFDISQKDWQISVEELVKQWYNSDKLGQLD